MTGRDPLVAMFLARSPRERWLLIVAALLAGALLAWVGVYRPLMSALDTAKARHVLAVRQHATVLAQLAQLDSVARPSATAGAGPSLALRVTESAARSGVALAANEPRGPGRVAITMAAATPTATLRWLRELEQGGIIVSEMALTSQGQGMVAISATLADGGIR